MTLKEIYAIPVNGDGWRLLPNGNYLHLGINVVSDIDLAEIGSGAKIGAGAEIGSCAKIGSGAEIGADAKIGAGAEIGADAKIPPKAQFPYSPLAVQGSRHLAGNYVPGMIQIGCLVNSYEYWKQNYRTIGEQQGYTSEQIAEYGRIIDFIVANGMPVK